MNSEEDSIREAIELSLQEWAVDRRRDSKFLWQGGPASSEVHPGQETAPVEHIEIGRRPSLERSKTSDSPCVVLGCSGDIRSWYRSFDDKIHSFNTLILCRLPEDRRRRI